MFTFAKGFCKLHFFFVLERTVQIKHNNFILLLSSFYLEHLAEMKGFHEYVTRNVNALQAIGYCKQMMPYCLFL
ncbi:hypothetical protein XENTR_v10013738 [Xenopus tropicalis]|nr:hypothetical protein XENTR_v10013738 [Xenopus tropicalis]